MILHSIQGLYFILKFGKLNEVHIELYTDLKDLAVEQQFEDVLDEHGIFYNKSETWIESEKLYEVLYTFYLGMQ